MKGTPEERFWAKVDKRGPDECWPWKGAIDPVTGYARFWDGDRLTSGHRFSYALQVGPLPPGRDPQLDHLCRHRWCVNSAHLELVTQTENIRRGDAPRVNGARNAAKTHCPHGHPYSPENTLVSSGKRRCRTCMRAWWRAWHERIEVGTLQYGAPATAER